MTTTSRPKPPTAASGADPGGFSVEPAELSAAAGTFSAEAAALGQALQALSSHIGAVGACWGNDEEGKKFGASYLKGADQMLADLADLQTGLETVAGALGAAASAYQTADAASSVTAPTEAT